MEVQPTVLCLVAGKSFRSFSCMNQAHDGHETVITFQHPEISKITRRTPITGA